MPDDKKETAPQDAERLNVDEDYEVSYWTEEFQCTSSDLKAAVRKVGVMAEDVELEWRRGR